MNGAEYRLGLFLVTTSAVAWSTAGFFTRLIPLDSWTLLAWRGVFGAFGIAVVIVAMERGRTWWCFRHMQAPAWLFVVVSAVGMVFFITSLKHTTVAHVAVIYATVPLVAASIGWWLLRERPKTSAVLASLAALAGVAVMVGFGLEGSLFGDALAMGMTLCVAALMLIARRFRDIPVLPAACLSALLSGLVCWPLGAPLTVTGQALLLLAVFGIVNSAVGLALFTLGARYLPVIETALLGALDAPLAPLWVWLAFQETPGTSTIIGGLIVFIAVGMHLGAEYAGVSRRRRLAVIGS